MTFKLNTALAMDSIVDEEDVRALKSALNRLGYYMPYEKTGITDMPDTHMFDALKRFQSDHGLKPDGIIRPDDQSFLAIAAALESDIQGRFYIWRTVRDDHVRSQHAAREGKVFSWNKAPEGGHPGEDYNCRCWAEPASQEQYWQMVDPPIEPAYPEALIFSIFKIERGVFMAAQNLLKKIRNLSNSNSLPTDHGKIRMSQRNISKKEIDEAIRTARRSGNIVTKNGKYGTPQNIYTGSNGITVVEETTGRNAGKIITSWRH